MPTPIGTDLVGAAEWSLLDQAEESPGFLPTTVGIRLSDILNLRVGCWRPAVYLAPCDRVET
jgi:hypothetical protein